MQTSGLQEEIRDLNLAYLMLAQQMLREDREAAMFRLGIGGDVAELMLGLSPAQLVKMSNSQMMLCRFRFDDSSLFGLLAGNGRQAATAGVHAAIIAASKPVAALA
ncbi:MAG: flagellar transcriptional regulator FlhD [Rhodocyclaceae bacterium]|nr:flagellar transcriptional regulator FlhD [Rhodocyclaceae bacterium]